MKEDARRASLRVEALVNVTTTEAAAAAAAEAGRGPRLRARGGVRLERCAQCGRGAEDHPFLRDLGQLSGADRDLGVSPYSRVLCDGSRVMGWRT